MAEDDPITVLSEEESWSLLAGVTLGRVVTTAAGKPEIFPVNFVAKRPTVLFKTAPGTKLLTAAMNREVAFEADDHTFTEGLSVIVRGIARVDPDRQTVLRVHRRVGDQRPTVHLRLRARSGVHLRLTRPAVQRFGSASLTILRTTLANCLGSGPLLYGMP